MNNACSDPAWHQVTVTTTHTALAEAVFEHFEASAVTVLDAGDEPTVEHALNAQPAFASARIVGLFTAASVIEPVVHALKGALGADAVIESAQLEAQDWANAWIAHHPPLHFGGRLWVAPHNAPINAPDDAVIIRLDPGLAFGTGTHATTALCLSWLASSDLSGLDVLDYGCGSGILALAAARLGAARVTAVDIDPQATRATRENAEVNGIANRIDTPALDALGEHRYDIVLANILARPLIDLAPTLSSRGKPGSRIVLSGILSRQVEVVRDAYQSYFEFSQPTQKDDWMRLDGISTKPRY